MSAKRSPNKEFEFWDLTKLQCIENQLNTVSGVELLTCICTLVFLTNNIEKKKRKKKGYEVKSK